jgi:hypothetical protein
MRMKDFFFVRGKRKVNPTIQEMQEILASQKKI